MPFHIGADSGQGRSSGGLSVGGDAVGVPAGALCFRPPFFIALAMDFFAAGRAAVRFSSGANATKTDVGGCVRARGHYTKQQHERGNEPHARTGFI